MGSPISNGHTRKRPYQPSIRSYFDPRDPDQTADLRRAKGTSSLSPPLPPDTQASLLSVGMRVRKSVPEGYKTHKTLGTLEVPFPSTAPEKAMTTPLKSRRIEGSRELQPFCGLHKIGGWAAQSAPPSSAPAAMQSDSGDEEDMLELSTSQNTILSTQGSLMPSVSAPSAPSRKRTFEDDIEDDMDAYFDQVEDADPDDRSQVATSRPIARVKPALRKAATDGLVRVVYGHDFEEASFLAPPDDMELDGLE
ncbi:hypothetical protein ES702_06466 [subsurface metagenome]